MHSSQFSAIPLLAFSDGPGLPALAAGCSVQPCSRCACCTFPSGCSYLVWEVDRASEKLPLLPRQVLWRCMPQLWHDCSSMQAAHDYQLLTALLPSTMCSFTEGLYQLQCSDFWLEARQTRQNAASHVRAAISSCFVTSNGVLS